MRVLLVEDDRQLAEVTARGLRIAGFAVDLASTGEEAIDLASENDYPVVVLDRNLPGISGDDVCRQLLSRYESPRIIMLTAAGSIQARVEGLAAGADDYMPKPFAMAELVARLHALLRRPSRTTPTLLTIGDVTVEPAYHRASRRDRPLNLTAKEFGVLQVLASTPGAVVSAESLLARVWDEHADPFTNAVRITVMTLRRKLGEPPLIETVIGVGYRLVDDAR